MRAWYFVGVYDWTSADHDGRPPYLARPEAWPASGEEPRAVAQAFFRSAAAAKLIVNVPSHCDIVSNAAQVVQVSYKRRARSVLEPVVATDIFATLPKPSVLIFMALPGVDIQGLRPPGPAYRTIRDPVFVAFEDAACRPEGYTP